MFNSDYYLNLIRNKPIIYNGLQINIMSLSKICEYGAERYEDLMLPFALTPACFKTPVQSILRDGILTDIKLFNAFVEMLSLTTGYSLCRPTAEYVDLFFEHGADFRIDDSNFDDICDIILKMNAKSKIEVTKRPETKSARINDIYDKIEAGRKRFAEKNKVNLWDMLNICEFAGDYHIPMSEIEEWSLWKISNCYKARLGWKSYDEAFDIAMVSGETKNITGENHWFKQLMIRE